MQVLVMGGTRFMGVEVVTRLVERGHEVTLFNRGTRPSPFAGQVRQVTGDRDDADAVHGLRSLALDAVVDLSAYTAAQTSLLLDALGGVDRLVHCSTGAVYQPSPVLPWPEETPYGPWGLWGAYAVEKTGCERLLKDRRDHDAVATTVLRLPYVLGPANYVAREEFVLNRLLDNQVCLLPGDGKAVQQFVSAAQVGQAFCAAVEAAEQPGWRPYNVADPDLASLEGFVQVCADVAGVEPRIESVGGGATGNAQPVFDAGNPVFPFPNENYALDTAASREAGIAPEPVGLRAMIEAAYESLLAAPERRSWTRTQAEDAVAGAAAGR